MQTVLIRILMYSWQLDKTNGSKTMWKNCVLSVGNHIITKCSKDQDPMLHEGHGTVLHLYFCDQDPNKVVFKDLVGCMRCLEKYLFYSFY
jgi:hypothetical protein